MKSMGLFTPAGYLKIPAGTTVGIVGALADWDFRSITPTGWCCGIQSRHGILWATILRSKRRAARIGGNLWARQNHRVPPTSTWKKDRRSEETRQPLRPVRMRNTCGSLVALVSKRPPPP